MRITGVEAIPVRLPRARDAALGTAGSPTELSGGGAGYRRSERVGALYSEHFETALIKVTLDSGLIGWGEAQAPLAPQVACSIVDLLLRPVLESAAFDGSQAEIEFLWDRMYATMRVRGQTGGFMLDAISGVDLALWDLAGLIAGRPVAELLGGTVSRQTVPAYLSGVSGSTVQERVEWARPYVLAGVRTLKVFFNEEAETLFETVQVLRAELGVDVAVDALWRLSPESAPGFGRTLDELGACWLEAPLPPEDPMAHGALARSIRTPLALGESYRTCHELAPFFREGALSIVQPDLGRCGITEGLRIAEMARSHGAVVIPHVSIALGPQIAAAIHYASAVDACPMLEFNPNVFSVANRFLAKPLELAGCTYRVPASPGLGAKVLEESLKAQNL